MQELLKDEYAGLWLLIFTLVIWLLRKTPLGFLWKVWSIFFVALFIVLGVNFAKDELKKWWNK